MCSFSPVKQEDELKQETEEDQQLAALAQASPAATTQLAVVGQPGQPPHMLPQPGAPSPLMQSPAAAQLQMLQQPGALVQSPPPPLGAQAPVMSLSASPVPGQPSIVSSAAMSSVMSSLGMPMPLMSQAHLPGIMPQAFVTLPGQAIMAYPG